MENKTEGWGGAEHGWPTTMLGEMRARGPPPPITCTIDGLIMASSGARSTWARHGSASEIAARSETPPLSSV